jgi:hypothetical protein
LCGKRPEVLDRLRGLAEQWQNVFRENGADPKVQPLLVEILDNFTRTALSGYPRECTAFIRKLFSDEIESLDPTSKKSNIPAGKLARIQTLIEAVDESKGETGSPDRLNKKERNLFLKNPFFVQRAFTGQKTHITADRIIRKMKNLDLGPDDVDAVHDTLRALKEKGDLESEGNPEWGGP